MRSNLSTKLFDRVKRRPIFGHSTVFPSPRASWRKLPLIIEIIDN